MAIQSVAIARYPVLTTSAFVDASGASACLAGSRFLLYNEPVFCEILYSTPASLVLASMKSGHALSLL